ncbi:hypothetical protein JKF63_00564 [Porcisia hertigi]|uniref:Uncharacterized protein n=1 Tax=Porcisia hertigi TaxID=2761500 RepID=A0A836KX99_9TRYP|nr:hypothetical protein JKF63_00564 [Porcisia hertigi]
MAKMQASWTFNAQPRVASPPSPRFSPAQTLPAVFSAQQAGESIEFLQRELSRLLRACEYREHYPFNTCKKKEGSVCGAATPHSASGSNGASTRTTSKVASHKRDTTVSPLSGAEPALNLALSTTSSSSFTLDPHSGDAADSASFSSAGTGAALAAATTAADHGGISFSAFEKRRIAHLLGRVALEVAALWMYIHNDALLCGVSPADAIAPTSSISVTTREKAWQSSDCDPAVQAASPSALASSTAVGGDGSALAEVDFPGAERSVVVPAVTERSVRGESAKERRELCHSGLVAQITALSALFGTAVATQRSVERAPCKSGDQSVDLATNVSAAATPDVGTETLWGAAAAASTMLNSSLPGSIQGYIHEAVDVVSGTQRDCGTTSVEVSPLVAVASQAETSALSGVLLTAPEGSALHTGEVAVSPLARPVPTAARRARSDGLQRRRSSAPAPSIPSQLCAYVADDGVDGCGNGTLDASEANIISRKDDSTTVGANSDRYVSRCTSAGGGDTRFASHIREHLVSPHDDRSHTRPSSGNSAMEHAVRVDHLCTAASDTRTGLPGSAPSSFAVHTWAGGSGGVTTMVAPPLETAPVSDSSSLRVQCAFSALSLPTASLMSRPLQAPQFSTQRSQGHSGGSASSQPNASAALPSPDSAEMSPAATAAYLRSSSLFRRPHRFEVPVSRTQSLRRMPSISSSVSLAGASLGSPPGVSQHNGTLTAASGAHANSSVTSSHMAKSNSILRLSSGGVGVLRTPSYFAGIPPVVASASTTVDSPHSSVAGLHFKRVISLDSECGVWPQGSFADSLEMSQHKVASLVGRPSTFALERTLSSPLQHEAGLGAAAGSNSDHYRPLPAPAEGQSGEAFPVATSSSGPRSPVLPLGRAGHTHNHTTKSCHGTPNPAVSSSPTVAVLSNTLGGSSSCQLPAALLSPVHFSSSYPRNTLGTVTAPTAFASASAIVPGDLAADALALNSYRVEERTLTDFLRCLHDLRRTSLTDAEFDSLELRYFLPGVSRVLAMPPLLKPGFTSPPPAPPLPLFEGGELVPLHRGSLDYFCSLVRERLVEVCRHLRISAAPYLALL